MVILSCKCGKKVKEEGSFHEVSSKNKWVKEGKFYFCPECQRKNGSVDQKKIGAKDKE